jgi:hypothetical protein
MQCGIRIEEYYISHYKTKSDPRLNIGAAKHSLSTGTPLIQGISSQSQRKNYNFV